MTHRSILSVAATVSLVILGSSISVSGQGGTGRIQNPSATKKDTSDVCSAKSPTKGTGRTQTAKLSSGISLEMVEIPAGSFCMGSSLKREGKDEKPAHKVTFANGFFLGKYEVTQGQWQAVMGNNPSNFKGENLPVERVSWKDVQWFVNKLNEMNDGFYYRLPTEAEWEYACRAGTTGDFSGYLDGMAWYSVNSGNTTHQVGTKTPNGFGLYDMHGNVWEWCQDSYHESYEGAPTDGRAWVEAKEEHRMLRGGSYNDYASFLRSAFRVLHPNWDERDTFFGFRVAAVPRKKSFLDARPYEQPEEKMMRGRVAKLPLKSSCGL